MGGSTSKLAFVFACYWRFDYWSRTLRLQLRRQVWVRVRGTPGGESGLEATHDDIELLRRAVDVQDGVFSIWREEEGEAVLADLDVGVVVSVRTRHVDAWKRDFDAQHCFPFGV